MSGDFEKYMIRELGEISGTVKQMDKKLDGLSARVAVLEGRPQKTLDWWKQAIIALIVGIIGGLLSPFSRS
jgi:hypothetical protein